jgi:hypothetical protein
VVGDTAALIVSEQVARADGDTALATQLDVLSAKVDSDTASTTALIVNEQTARASADEALAHSLESVAARLNDVSGSGKTVEAVILEDRQARVTGDQANATAVTALVARFNNADPSGKPTNSIEARVAREETARANADSGLAQSITQVSTRLNNAGGPGVTVEQKFTATASAIEGLSGQYTIKIDNNGHVSGFGLASTPVNGVPYSVFAVVADRFVIADATGDNVTPFQVIASPTYINGAYVPAGVYMQNAFIHAAAIDTLRIAGNAVTVPAAGNGVYAASVTMSFNENTNVVMIGTFTQGNGRNQQPWYLAVDGSNLQREIPDAGTLGAMSKIVLVGPGTHTFTIFTDYTSGDAACGITVLGAKR